MEKDLNYIKIDIYLSPKAWALRTLALGIGNALACKDCDINYLPINNKGRTDAKKFFLVYDHLIAHFRIFGQDFLQDSILMFTHFEERVYGAREILKRVPKILTMSESDAPLLLSLGLHERQIEFFPFGACDTKFKIQDIEKEYDFIFSLGFQADVGYGGRKNYRRLTGVIDRLSQLGHVVALMGPKWDQVDEVKTIRNLTIVECNHSDYVDHYSKARILVSLSNYEGGPLSLLEGLLCGIPIIATSTGFAPQIVRESREKSIKIGRLVSVNISESDAVISCIDALRENFSRPDEIRTIAQDYSFSRAADFLIEMMVSSKFSQ